MRSDLCERLCEVRVPTLSLEVTRSGTDADFLYQKFRLRFLIKTNNTLNILMQN